MPSVLIVIDVAGQSPGVPGASREFLNAVINPTAPLVTLSLNDTAGVESYYWEFLDVPAGTAPVFDNPISATPTFTPDDSTTGTYLMRCTINDSDSRDVIGISFKTEILDLRKLAAGEAGLFDSIKGWVEAYNDLIDKVDTSGFVGDIFILGGGSSSAVRSGVDCLAEGDYSFSTGKDNDLDTDSDYSAVFGHDNQLVDAKSSLVAGKDLTLSGAGFYGNYNAFFGDSSSLSASYCVVGGSQHNVTTNASNSAVFGFSNSSGGNSSFIANSSNTLGDFGSNSAIFGSSNTIEDNYSKCFVFGDDVRSLIAGTSKGDLFIAGLGHRFKDCSNVAIFGQNNMNFLWNKGFTVSLVKGAGDTMTVTDTSGRFSGWIFPGSDVIEISGSTTPANNGSWSVLTYADGALTFDIPAGAGVADSANPDLRWLKNGSASDKVFMAGSFNSTYNAGLQDGLIAGAKNTACQGAGYRSLIAGLSNDVFNNAGEESVIVGNNNRVSSGAGKKAVILGDHNNIDTGGSNSLILGSYCEVDASNGTMDHLVLTGGKANGSKIPFAHITSGWHYSDSSVGAPSGEAQNISMVPFTGQTVNENPTKLWVDGAKVSKYFKTITNHVYTFSILVSAKNNDAVEAKCWELKCAFINIGGTLTQLGTTVKTMIGATAVGGESTWDIDVAASTTEFYLSATGEAGHTINWQCNVTAAEISGGTPT